MSNPSSTASRVVLITGASTGIGRTTARLLTAHAFTVFGTSRNPAQVDMASEAFTLVQLDVTDAESVAACVAEVIARAGRLDVLISNAGVDLTGALEETTIEEAQSLFDTNYFGAVRMVNAALPHLRESVGQIVLVSSALGRAAWPFNGQYCASKFALEGYTEALAYEMELFGIRVSSVQPGFFASEMYRNTREAQSLPLYADPRRRATQLNQAWADVAPPPDAVARTILHILNIRRPRLRYPVSLEAIFTPPIAGTLPLTWRLKVGRWLLGLDDPRHDAIGAAKAGGVLAAGLFIGRALVRRLWVLS